MPAGLLARGSLPFVAFPGPSTPVASDERFTAYSCGGSRGIGTSPAPHSLLIPRKGNRPEDGRSLLKTESMPEFRYPKHRCFAILRSRGREMHGHLNSRPEVNAKVP